MAGNGYIVWIYSAVSLKQVTIIVYGWALHSLLLGDHHCACSSLVFTLRTGFFSADLLSGDHFNVLNDPFPGFSPCSALTFATLLHMP